MIQLLKDQFWINVEAWRIWADKKTTQWDPCKDRAQKMSLSLPRRPHSQWEILKENLWKNCGLEDWILRVRREGVRSCVEQTLGRRGIFGEQGCMIKTEKKGRQSPGSYWIISNGPLLALSLIFSALSSVGLFASVLLFVLAAALGLVEYIFMWSQPTLKCL